MMRDVNSVPVTMTGATMAIIQFYVNAAPSLASRSTGTGGGGSARAGYVKKPLVVSVQTGPVQVTALDGCLIRHGASN